VNSLPPKPVTSATAAAPSKPSVTPTEQFVTARQQDLPGPSNPKQGAGNKSENGNSAVLDKAGNVPVVKEPSVAAHANKNKAQNGKALTGNGGSLANMWGRASAKPKPPATTNFTAVASVAGIVPQMFIFIQFVLPVYNSHQAITHVVLSTKKKHIFSCILFVEYYCIPHSVNIYSYC